MGKSRQEALNLAHAVIDYLVAKDVFDKASEGKNITPIQAIQFRDAASKIHDLAKDIINKEQNENKAR